MSKLLIKGGRVIDPASGVDAVRDILIVGGEIAIIERNISSEGTKVIDAKGKWVTPGLIDIHVHLREPGYEYKETIETGTRSAAAGGFTSVACMANTSPVNDCASVTEYIKGVAKSKGVVNVFPIGAVTHGLKGEALADIAEMADAGVVALSDDGHCVMNPSTLRAALEYAGMFGLPVIEHAEDTHLKQNGVMNEGIVSTELGLAGNPRTAEETIIARDVLLAEYTGQHIHFAHVSTAGSVEIIRQAKARGVKVTAEAAPHHFTLTDEAVRKYDTNAKMAPPLREKGDIDAIKQGLADGAIDCIATDHAPHGIAEKEVEFDNALFGIVGLETALPLSLNLVREGVLTPMRLVETMSLNPAKVIGVKRGTLEPGAVADVTIIAPDAEWTVDPSQFKSKGRNTPFAGWKMKGRAVVTIVKGKVVYELED
jgi:dihydroorotase